MGDPEAPAGAAARRYPRRLSGAEHETWRDKAHAGETLEAAIAALRWQFRTMRGSKMKDAELDRDREFQDAHVEVAAIFAEYEALCKAEIQEIRRRGSAILPDFNAAILKAAERNGWPAEKHHLFWSALRPKYLRRGIKDPVECLVRIKQAPRFLGRYITGGVDPEMAQTIIEAEQNLRAMGEDAVHEVSTALIKPNIGGSYPRPIDNPRADLSYHALGRALDIDAEWNPFVKEGAIKAIDGLLDWLGTRQQAGSDRLATLDAALASHEKFSDGYLSLQRDSMKVMSDDVQHFLRAHLDAWTTYHQSGSAATLPPEVAAAYAALEDFLTRMGAVVRNRSGRITMGPKARMTVVRRMRDRGFVTIPTRLFEAFRHAGPQDGGSRVRFGLDYVQGKDVMHIELLFTPVSGGRRRPKPTKQP
jgi:hypothetical protein